MKSFSGILLAQHDMSFIALSPIKKNNFWFGFVLSVPPPTPYITPQCNLPRNISGQWFTQGIQFESLVSINDTHIHYFTRKTEFVFEDAYLSCQQTLGTRFLMTKYIVGKWYECYLIYIIIQGNMFMLF